MKSSYLRAAVYLLLISTTVSAEEVYKWLDIKGQTHYGSNPPPGVSASQIDTYGPSSDSEKAIADLDAKKKAAEQAANPKKQEAKASTPLPKANDCETARNNYNMLKNAPSINTKNDKGEYVIANDDQRQKIIENAKAKVDSLCGKP